LGKSLRNKYSGN